MVVFFPFYRPDNNFLDEIEHYFNGTFIFDCYFNFHLYPNVDIIHIHWPEIIFNWEKIDLEKLEDFKNHYNEWKKDYKIVYTRHNIYPHSSTSNTYKKLYDFICLSVDAVIHMGNYSINEFKAHYPENEACHKLIEHPLYLKKANVISKKTARSYFKIGEKQKVILVFGQIRNKDEMKMIMSAFKKINVKNKVLLANKIKKFKLPSFFRTRFNYSYNKFIVKRLNSKSSYNLDFKFVEDDFVQYYFNAADTVLIPRINLLNSGNLYLACTFNKNIVAPLVGNISEKLQYLNADGYNPNRINSLVKALESSIGKKDISNNYEIALKKMHPKTIAKSHKNLYEALI